MKNRSQVTIFIILGIIIAAGVIAALYFMGKISIQGGEEMRPEKFIEKCIKESIEPSLEAVMPGGGRVQPSFFVRYQDDPYNYLCYNKNFYEHCVNFYPQLKEIVEEEIVRDSEQRIKDCFSQLKQNMEKRGFTVEEGVMNWNLEIVPKKVIVRVEKKMDFNQEEGSQSFNKFDFEILSPVYDLIMLARDIVNQEAQYCNFEYNGRMLLYPATKIKRIDYDGNNIYILTDQLTNKQFKFAVRSCVFPAGF